MEAFTSNFISKTDFEPIDTMLLKDYLSETFLNVLSQVKLFI